MGRERESGQEDEKRGNYGDHSTHIETQDKIKLVSFSVFYLIFDHFSAPTVQKKQSTLIG